jgi:hypothetical protein
VSGRDRWPPLLAGLFQIGVSALIWLAVVILIVQVW